MKAAFLCTDHLISEEINKKRGIYVFVCVWASRSVARAACPEHSANTEEEEAEEEEVIV